ncbi:MAG: glycosyltransferase, partial [Candidatus Zixiibacteriota bacterium]
MNRALKTYERIVGSNAISQLRQLARDLTGARVVHVNSTRVGGGVAEILDWLVPLMNDVGLETSWEVIRGPAVFYQTTKAFHNGLQGADVRLTQRMIEIYERTVAECAEELRPTLEAADLVIIHDPQPAALLEHCGNRRGKWVWRCHIDASRPNRKVWNYLRSKVNGYDASIFSMPDFTQHLDHPEFIIAPSIDPLSDKNCDLSEDEISSTLEELEVPRDLPILTQISRFDQFKDPIGVIDAFNLLNGSVPCRLVLAGGGATDDPEAAAVLDEVRDASNGNDRIHILDLPADAHRTINALQRASAIVIQKSTQEGFGLTVTEAMWKGKPVI